MAAVSAIPARLRRLPASYVRAALVALLVLLAAVLPTAYGDYLPQQLTTYLIFGLLALAVALLTGFARLLNIGLGANFGVSAYAVAILTQHHVLDPFVLFGGAMAAGLLVSILFSIYAVVAAGIQYIMLTFLTTLALFSAPLAATTLTGGDNGLSVKGDLGIAFGLNPLVGNDFYLFVLAVVVGASLLSWYVLASQAGKAVRAIGRNPVRASAMGYEVGKYRVALTLLAGFIASVAGWLYALQNAFVFQDLLGIQISLNGLLYALIGGVDTIIGPLLGAAGLRYFVEKLSSHSTQSSLYFGLALLMVVYLLPDGVLGFLQRLWRRIQLRRRTGTTADVSALEEAAAAETAFGGLSPEDETAI